MKKIFCYLLLLCLIVSTKAQEEYPVNYNTEINVITESLQKFKNSQNLQLIFNNNSDEPINSLRIRLENINAVLTLIAAELNNQPLWLFKTDTMVNRRDVIAWNFERTTGDLVLYPTNLTGPFVLDIQIQINLNQPESIDTSQEYYVKSEVILDRGIFESNRGNNTNIISFK